MKTVDVHQHLKEIVAMFFKGKEPWKANAFNKVAANVGKLKKLEFKDGKLITVMGGLGPATRDVIEQFAATGTSEKYKKLVAKFGKVNINQSPTFEVVRDIMVTLFQPLRDDNIDWMFAGELLNRNKDIHSIELVVKALDEEAITKVWLVLMQNGLEWNVQDKKNIVAKIKMENGKKIPMTIHLFERFEDCESIRNWIWEGKKKKVA